MAEHLQVFVTAARKEDVQTIAGAVVDQRLAACAQIVGPILSTYRWQGRVETEQEWLCLIKTSRAIYPELERAIRELHPYETPEIVALPIAAGSQAYLEWLGEQLKGASG